VVLEGI